MFVLCIVLVPEEALNAPACPMSANRELVPIVPTTFAAHRKLCNEIVTSNGRQTRRRRASYDAETWFFLVSQQWHRVPQVPVT